MVKKTKLTISGIAKKSIENIELAKTQGKNSVIIEKKNKFYNKGSLNRSSGNLRTKNKPTFQTKTSSFTKNFPPVTKSNDFEKRKLAEQRATKRLKGDQELKDKKSKSGSKKEKLN